MLGSLVTESLFGLTLLSVLLSFAFGVLAAYLLWGIRYMQVVEAEAKTAEAQKQVALFQNEQERLRKRLHDTRSTS